MVLFSAILVTNAEPVYIHPIWCY